MYLDISSNGDASNIDDIMPEAAWKKLADAANMANMSVDEMKDKLKENVEATDALTALEE